MEGRWQKVRALALVDGRHVRASHAASCCRRIEIESKVQFKPVLAQCPEGINQVFTQQPSDGIDTQAHAGSLRFSRGSRFFPLIIRIEAASATLHSAGCHPAAD